jgi:hypothetical protein
MRDFGFGKRYEKMENLMKKEIKEVVDVMNGRKEDKGIYRNGLDLGKDLLNKIMINEIW